MVKNAYLSGDDFDLHGLLQIHFIHDGDLSSRDDFTFPHSHHVFVEQFAARLDQLIIDTTLGYISITNLICYEEFVKEYRESIYSHVDDVLVHGLDDQATFEDTAGGFGADAHNSSGSGASVVIFIRVTSHPHWKKMPMIRHSSDGFRWFQSESCYLYGWRHQISETGYRR